MYYSVYQLSKIMKKHSERRKHCALTLVRLSQKISPRCRPLPGGAGRPNLTSWRWSLPLPTNPTGVLRQQQPWRMYAFYWVSIQFRLLIRIFLGWPWVPGRHIALARSIPRRRVRVTLGYDFLNVLMYLWPCSGDPGWEYMTPDFLPFGRDCVIQ